MQYLKKADISAHLNDDKTLYVATATKRVLGVEVTLYFRSSLGGQVAKLFIGEEPERMPLWINNADVGDILEWANNVLTEYFDW